MTVTAWPRIESPRNSSRSLCPIPPFSYAYERCVSARVISPGSISSCSTEFTSVRSTSPDGAGGTPAGSGSDVGDLAALVLEVQGRAGGVLHDLRAVREAVHDLAVLDRLHEVRHGCLPLRTAGVRVRTGKTALGNGHGCLYFRVRRGAGGLLGVGCVRAEGLERRPPGVGALAVLRHGAIRQLLPRGGVEAGAVRPAD